MPNQLLEIASGISREARTSLSPDLLKMSGRVLYSPASTLLSNSPIYFLGLNPGYVEGDPQLHNNVTIDADLDRLATNQICEHAYLDERWGREEFGQAKMQKRAQHVFTILAGGKPELGCELLRKTPASNMIFARAKNDVELKGILGKSGEYMVEQCWRFHQAVIGVTKPVLVLAHAVGRAKELARIRNLGPGQAWPSGHGAQPNLYAWQLPEGPKFLAIPNLSRYDPRGPREHALRRFFHEVVPHVIHA